LGVFVSKEIRRFLLEKSRAKKDFSSSSCVFLRPKAFTTPLYTLCVLLHTQDVSAVTFTSRTQRPLHPPKPAPADFFYIFLSLVQTRTFSLCIIILCTCLHILHEFPFFLLTVRSDNNNNPPLRHS
jgi:hypothetical protein